MKRVTHGESKMRNFLPILSMKRYIVKKKKKVSGWNSLNIWIRIMPWPVTRTSSGSNSVPHLGNDRWDYRIPIFPSSLRIWRLGNVAPTKTYQNRTQSGPCILCSICPTAREMEQEAKRADPGRKTCTLHHAAGRHSKHPPGCHFSYPAQAKHWFLV